ncbi:hypothetical protein SAMN06265379_1022 [Saccharicrinis carchari]|uniref:Uncharacterized protein n=1 Tax=Saccharicrinis carchari TaxID=1168039 RepID=A0A521BQZ3_SACCC|nr:hypothetical protein SAMN06265379_1022 [Saccharicrinis carchari]
MAYKAFKSANMTLKSRVYPTLSLKVLCGTGFDKVSETISK